MISKYTWPTYRGSDREGVKTIIDEKRFSSDVQYGKTKIFIKSPQTVFQLEQVRSEILPSIIVFLQKNWRGGIARMRYRKMIAIYKIMDAYRRYKLKSYIVKLADTFRGVHQMRDYGKSVTWPRPPQVLSSFVQTLMKVHERWRAYMILRKIPVEERPSMHLKVYAADALKGRRREWGFTRKWEGNYLSSTQDNHNTADFGGSVNKLKGTDQFTRVLFTSFVKKTNKHNKTADRAVLFTDRFIYKLDPKKKFKAMRKGTPLTDITGISVSTGNDQLIIVHLQHGNDFVLCLQNSRGEERVGEIVGILTKLWHDAHKRELKLIVNNQLHCSLGGKSKTVTVESSTMGPVFKKNGAGLILHWPS